MGIFKKLFDNKPLSPTAIRDKNNQYIKKMGIACNEHLPCIEYDSSVNIKDIDSICKRAVACLLSIQLACDIRDGNDYDESKALFLNLIKEYGVEKELLDVEKRLFENKYDMQDAINVSMTYECYWSLVWALGLINSSEFKIPNDICDCEKAIKLVADCGNFDKFKKKTKIRNAKEILSMLDLYYRYDWACVENRINPKTYIGNLNHAVVAERRRGLEWLVSEIEDWNEISLDT